MTLLALESYRLAERYKTNKFEQMNIRIIFSILSWIMISSTISAQDIEWKEIEGDDKAWYISMPGEAEYYEKEILTDVGEMKVVSYMLAPEYSEEQANLMYLLEYYDYPEGTFHKDSTELKQLFLEQTAIATSEEVGGTLVYQSEISLKGHPGMIYRCQYKEGDYIMKSKMYLINDRFYHLKAYCRKENALNDEMDRYLDSFELGKW